MAVEEEVAEVHVGTQEVSVVVEAAEACAVVIEAVACAAEVEEVVEAKLSQSLKVNWMLSLMPITTKLLVEVIQPPHKTGL